MKELATFIWAATALMAVLAWGCFNDGWRKGGIVCSIITLALLYVALGLPAPRWSYHGTRSDHCYTAWDGRSNPTECD